MPTETQRLRFPRADSFLWVFLGALLLRGFYLFQAVRHNELIAHPVVDENVYLDWARDILAGTWLWPEPINYTPGHPVWLAAWLAIFGWKPTAHFAVFLLLGAIQAVIIGRTAETIWDRRVGLVTAWLAATYWPWIVFEASWFAEPFAILNLSLALFLVTRWSRHPASLRPIFWSGFCLGWSILARANAMLCAPVLGAWILWVCLRASTQARLRRAVAAGLAFSIPIVLLLAPVLFWNWKISGRAMLRTDGWLSMYAGNDPAFHALAVPPGIRWEDFTYRPVRAGFTEAVSKEAYWRNETLRVIREQPAAWLRLMGCKALMVTGSFEVSQEIDIAIFRRASSVLSLPLWPGWALIIPLALCGVLAMLRSPSARRGWPLALCAAAYFASILPVQAAARYRLPVLVPLLPLAGWAIIALGEALRRRDRHVLFGFAATIGLTGLLISPDWLQLGREKIINHWFLLGLKRATAGDDPGAFAAFKQGAAWNPLDPDCPLRLGRIAWTRGEVSQARQFYQQSLDRYAVNPSALFGLGECALAESRPEEALQRVQEILRIAPNNLDALGLASRAFEAQGDWPAVARACAQMRSYSTYPATVAFSEARAWTLAGQPANALPLYDTIAGTLRFAEPIRQRAAFLAGTLAWRLSLNRQEALRRWSPLASSAPGFFQILGSALIHPELSSPTLATLPEDLPPFSTLYVHYTRALIAWMSRDATKTRSHLERVLSTRAAEKLPIDQRDVLEIWAASDIKQLPPPLSSDK